MLNTLLTLSDHIIVKLHMNTRISKIHILIKILIKLFHQLSIKHIQIKYKHPKALNSFNY